MNKLIFSAFMLLFSLASYAQQITPEIKIMFKNDDISNFDKIINKENINKCYLIEEFSYSLLALSIKMNKPNVFKKLINEKANLDLICDDKTPLMYTVKYGNLDFAKLLLENGANKKAISNKGNTALDYAKKYDQKELIKILD
ncbi:ankyrin repeat domain-containing protein [Cloacibacterium caeni]|uniref:ankyrin repeat domain-containing protein n=1 Tax=Cloacibacterium caeni TaxID=2004710 RepID=UPI001FEBBD0C|nr:ankyrin repeat domain-containing protein [Cloacibacterium caeni]